MGSPVINTPRCPRCGKSVHDCNCPTKKETAKLRRRIKKAVSKRKTKEVDIMEKHAFDIRVARAFGWMNIRAADGLFGTTLTGENPETFDHTKMRDVIPSFVDDPYHCWQAWAYLLARGGLTYAYNCVSSVRDKIHAESSGKSSVEKAFAMNDFARVTLEAFCIAKEESQNKKG